MLPGFIIILIAATIIIVMELLVPYLKYKNIEKAYNNNFCTATYRLIIINKKTKKTIYREYTLNNASLYNAEYTAVMNIIKELKLYHLCPCVNLMLRPQGLNGKTYKIYSRKIVS